MLRHRRATPKTHPSFHIVHRTKRAQIDWYTIDVAPLEQPEVGSTAQHFRLAAELNSGETVRPPGTDGKEGVHRNIIMVPLVTVTFIRSSKVIRRGFRHKRPPHQAPACHSRAEGAIHACIKILASTAGMHTPWYKTHCVALESQQLCSPNGVPLHVPHLHARR